MSAPTRRLAALVATVSLALVAAPAAAAACPDADVEAASLGESQLEDAVVCLINERRDNAGAPPVRVHPRLRHAAVNHSDHMVGAGFFGHTAPNGSGFVDRIESSGYTRGARRWLVGENLVWGTSTRSTPESLVQSWMESPPHRANLLRGQFREVGVGVRRGTPYNAGEPNGVTVSSEYGFRAVSRARVSRKRRYSASGGWWPPAM
jgi:uncharacterized protein YkwD